MMDVTKEHKDHILNQIVETAITALENDTLAEDQLQVIANYTLSAIDTITTGEQMVTFLSGLSEKWPLFASIEQLEKAQTQEKVESEVAEGVLTLAKTGNIDDAIKLAKSVTES